MKTLNKIWSPIESFFNSIYIAIDNYLDRCLEEDPNDPVHIPESNNRSLDNWSGDSHDVGNGDPLKGWDGDSHNEWDGYID